MRAESSLRRASWPKAEPAWFRCRRAASIPTITPAAGVTAKVIAGECAGTRALVQPLVAVQYIDFMSDAQERVAAWRAKPIALL